MEKRSQSILDFINIFNSDKIDTKTSMTHHSDVLMKIWDGGRDQYGNVIVPKDVPISDINDLINAGLIKQKWSNSNSVEITSRGSQLLKNSILSKTSVFKDKNVKQS